MNVREILKKYKAKCRKSVFSASFLTCNSIRFKYIKKHNVILVFLYRSYKNIGRYDDVFLLDENKKVYKLDKNNVVELKFDEYSFIFNLCYNMSLFDLLKFRKMFKTNVYLNNDVVYRFNDIELFYKMPIRNDKCPDYYPLSKLSIKDIFSVQFVEHKYTGRKLNMFFITKTERFENNVVIRIFAIHNFRATELHRIYIEKDTVLKFCKNTINGWQKVTDNKCYYDFNFNVKNIEKFKGTRLYHCKDIFENKEYNNYLTIPILFLENPIIEQLYKAGLSDFIHLSLDDIFDNGVEDFIIDKFGYFNNGKSNLYGKLGINKYQFNKIKESEKYIDAICMLRFVFGKDLSSIDNKQFDNACNIIFDLIYSKTGNEYYSHNRTNIIRNLIISIIKKIKKIKKNSAYLMEILEMLTPDYDWFDTERYVELLEYYSTYINIVIDIQKLTDELYDLEFIDEYDLMEMLESAEIVLETLKNTKKTQKFKKHSEELKKYLYENSDFVILCPQTPKELVHEGRQLRHCVADFTNKIIKGKSDIFFLRKKENENKPFFTIEVNPKKRKIKQVHGFDNSNITKDSLEYKFLQEWARNKKLKIGKINELYDAG